MSAVDPAVEQLCEALRQASAAAAHEAQGKYGDMGPEIGALVPDLLCVGVAHTVQAVAGYGDEIVRAADEAPAGAVIVIDVGGREPACTWGGTGTLIAQRRGVAGVVSNGYVRDISEIRRARFPVFARGTVSSGWRQGCAGATGVAVRLAGQTVRHGDIICADDDGIVVIARESAAELIPRLHARLRFEREADRVVRSGGCYADVMKAKEKS